VLLHFGAVRLGGSKLGMEAYQLSPFLRFTL